ncbi:MAG: class I adenylate-forming enzyme family protein [Oleiphilaceae bacterium]|nr:class I adenylate-forming enzyme family protein [Oleiphilaceae bacterium]
MSWARVQFIFDRELNAGNFLDKAYQRHGDFTFLHFDQQTLLGEKTDHVRLSQLIAQANRVSRLLLSHSIERFNRVAIYQNNSPDYFLLGMATIRAGGIAVPIHGDMATDIFIEYVNNTGSRYLFTDSERYAELLEAGFLEKCPCVEQVFITDQTGQGDQNVFAETLAGFPAEFEPVSPWPDEDIFIVHTSGTTGIPKGVLHTSGSFIAGLKGMLKIQPVFKGQRFLSAMPYNHFISYQGISSAAIAGNEGLLLQKDVAANVLDCIQSFRPQVVFCFPHIYVDIYDYGLESHDLSSVKLWMAGADSSHEAHIREFLQYGSLLGCFGQVFIPSAYIDSLGTSEVGFPAFIKVSTKYSKTFSRCIGRSTFAGPRVKVADENGRKVKRLETGRLMVKGPTLFKGYWNAHDRLHGVVKDGWWWTGDMGYRDRRGRYFHLDRCVDQIHSANGVLSSLLLEEHVLKHQGVTEAVVVARNTPDEGQQPLIFVQSRRGRSVSKEEMELWVREALPEGVRCGGVQFVDREAIPRGLTGKVLKRQLREDMEERDTV